MMSYLHVLAQEKGFLDWLGLSSKGPDESVTLLDCMLSGKAFRQEIAADHTKHQIIQAWYFASRNAERLKADRPLGIGYPLLVMQERSESISAPLIVWPLQLEPGNDYPMQWWLSYQPDYQPLPNYVLLKWLAEQFKADLTEALLSLVGSTGALKSELPTFCTRLAEQVCVDNPSQNIAMMPCPKTEADALSQAPGAVYWSAALGWFPAFPPFSAPGQLKNALSSLMPPEITVPFGAFELEPFQEAAIEIFNKKGGVYVKGAAGTGKTHLLTHLITEALVNGKRCLVVSKSIPALKQIQDQLVGLGLEKLQFFLRDEVADKAVLLETLKIIAKGDAPLIGFDEAAFRRNLDKALRNTKKLDERFKALHKPVFGDNNWTETVGMYLAAMRREGKELLSNQLNAQDFSFDFEEFRMLKQAVEGCYPLFQKVNTLNHPLRNLNAGIFIHKQKADGLAFIKIKLEEFLEKAQRIQLAYIASINEYSDQLTDHYERYFSELLDLAEKGKDLIRDKVNEWGEAFLHAGRNSLKLRSVFSGRQKLMLNAVSEVEGAQEELLNAFKVNSYFDYTFPAVHERRQVGQIKKVFDAFEHQLREWRDGLSATIQEEIQRLSNKTLNPKVGYREKILDLELELDGLIEQINESGLYQLPMENKMLTIPKRLKYLEDIIDQMETTRLNLRDYDAFYDWQRHWFKLSETARRIVRALAKVRPPDWVGALESWYLNNCLSKAYDTTLPMRDFDLATGVGALKSVIRAIPGKIQYQWIQRRDDALRSAKRKERGFYERYFGKRNTELCGSESLSDLLSNGFEELTAVLPVWLTTPRHALELLKQKGNRFDLLLVDEGHEIEPDWLAPLAERANHLAIFADPRINENFRETLVSKGKDQGLEVVTLSVCHRWKAGDITAFIGKDIEWDENALGPAIMHFEQVDGRYDPITGINDAEAQRVLQLLNEVRPTPQRTLPQVGIVCLTQGQRDHIAGYLLQIKQKRLPGVEKIQQLERNGLGVYTLGELSGLSFDIVILSGTFGITDLKGSLPDIEKVLNQDTTVGHLFQLMGRAINTVFIVNSIPQDILEEWTQLSTRKGAFLLANYYGYAQALAAADPSWQEGIVYHVKNGFGIDPTYRPSIFAAEVIHALAAYVPQGKIQMDYPLGEWHLPIVIHSWGETPMTVAFEPDGYFAKAGSTNLIWEARQRERLLENGLHFMPIWSAAWWKAPQQEARKLAGWIIQNNEDKKKTPPNKLEMTDNDKPDET